MVVVVGALRAGPQKSVEYTFRNTAEIICVTGSKLDLHSHRCRVVPNGRDRRRGHAKHVHRSLLLTSPAIGARSTADVKHRVCARVRMRWVVSLRVASYWHLFGLTAGRGRSLPSSPR